MDPTALISALNNTKKIVDYGFQLKGASEESRNAQKTLRIVQRDLNELKALAIALEATILPGEQRSIDDTICETNTVIGLMAAPNKRSIKDVKEHGTQTIYRRIMWTLRDGDAIRAYNHRLLVCHNSLTSQLTSLRMRQAVNAALGMGTARTRMNVWDDASTLAPDSAVGDASGMQRRLSSRSEAIMTDDLNDESLWENWLRDDHRKRSSTSRHSTLRRKPASIEADQEQDVLWLGEHAESELRGRSHLNAEIPTFSVPQDDMSFLAEDFNKAEEDDRRHRSGSRH